MKINDTEVSLKSLVTPIGNILAGLALAFLIDNIAMGGAVTAALPEGFVAFIGFVIFAGAAIYGFKQAKRLN